MRTSWVSGVGEDGLDTESASVEQEAVVGGEVVAVAEGDAEADGVEEGACGEVLVPFEGVDGGPDGVAVAPGADDAVLGPFQIVQMCRWQRLSTRARELRSFCTARTAHAGW